MDAEIGFFRDWITTGDGRLTDRLQLVVKARTVSEGTMLQTFAKRMGLKYDVCSGEVTIDEPESMPATKENA